MRLLVVLALVMGAAGWAAAAGWAHASSTCAANSGVTITQAPTFAGGKATVGFSVASGCDVQLSLVSYTAPSASYSDQTASQQVLYRTATDTFSSGSQTLSVDVPSCYFQLDFVYGTPIEQLGPAGSTNFYGVQGRLIHGEMGGSTSCQTSVATQGGGEASVTLCHATGSNTYTTVTASADVVSSQYLGVASSDIIPPFTYNGKSYSQNWTATGQATYGNGCKVVPVSSGGGNGNTPAPPPPHPPTPTVTAPPPAPAPSITLAKTQRVGATGDFTAGPVTAKVGDTVYYQLVVTDTGTTDVSANLSDAGCESVLPAGPQGISAGKSLTYTCSHTITAADGSTYTNTAVATATNASPTTASAQSSVSANIVTGGVAGASKSVTHHSTHKVVRHKRIKKAKKIKKVTHKAKAAHAVIAHAGVTG